jgi:hypothetical protein
VNPKLSEEEQRMLGTLGYTQGDDEPQTPKKEKK